MNSNVGGTGIPRVRTISGELSWLNAHFKRAQFPLAASVSLSSFCLGVGLREGHTGQTPQHSQNSLHLLVNLTHFTGVGFRTESS